MNECEKEEEQLLHAIIDGGEKIPQVKHFISYLQKQLSKTCLWARLGKETGDKLVRAAFGVIIKHGNLLFKFRNCMDFCEGKEFHEIELTP